MPSQTEIRQQVTQQIIAALESEPPPLATTMAGDPASHSRAGTPTSPPGSPTRASTLSCSNSMPCVWVSVPLVGDFPMWQTSAATSASGPRTSKEGHWGCRVVFWKPITKTVTDDQTGDEDEERFFVLKTFTVFNADQVEGEREAFQVHEDEVSPMPSPTSSPPRS